MALKLDGHSISGSVVIISKDATGKSQLYICPAGYTVELPPCPECAKRMESNLLFEQKINAIDKIIDKKMDVCDAIITKLDALLEIEIEKEKEREDCVMRNLTD